MSARAWARRAASVSPAASWRMPRWNAAAPELQSPKVPRLSLQRLAKQVDCFGVTAATVRSLASGVPARRVRRRVGNDNCRDVQWRTNTKRLFAILLDGPSECFVGDAVMLLHGYARQVEYSLE